MGLFGKLKSLRKKAIKPLRKPAGKIAKVAGPVLTVAPWICGPGAPACAVAGKVFVAREKVVTSRDAVKRANTIQERLNREYLASGNVGSDLRLPVDIAPTSYQEDINYTLYRSPTHSTVPDAYGGTIGAGVGTDNFEFTDDQSGLTPEQKAHLRATSAQTQAASRAGVPWFLILGLAAAYYYSRRT